MPVLNQIIAIQAGKKTEAKEALTKAYHLMQKPELLFGISKSYKPKDENGEMLPPETKLVQVKASDVIKSVTDELIGLFDIVATQDNANCQARADIVIDDVTIAKQVPVTTLLFLEKQVTDLKTFVGSLPTLDPAEQWSYDKAQDCFASQPFQTMRSKKVMRNHVKAEATDKHPAQVEVYTEDVTVGTYTTVKFSGAVPAQQKAALLVRVSKLGDAIKMARESANSLAVSNVNLGKSILSYVFGSTD